MQAFETFVIVYTIGLYVLFQTYIADYPATSLVLCRNIRLFCPGYHGVLIFCVDCLAVRATGSIFGIVYVVSEGFFFISFRIR